MDRKFWETRKFNYCWKSKEIYKESILVLKLWKIYVESVLEGEVMQIGMGVKEEGIEIMKFEI